MKKILTAPKAERCIGCGLCVLQASIISGGNIDLSKSYVKISGKPGQYKITIDYGVDTSDIRVVDICPRRCFEVKEVLE
jgi:NAD-dependent dihydropyrimidine dehydrogenase PreA subunit